VLPRSETIGIEGSVLAFAIAMSLVTGLGVGIVPALRATRSDLRADLSDAAGRSSASVARHRTLRGLIVGEIALSVVLLTGAGLVIRSFVALLSVDSGFDAERVLTFNAAPPARTIPDSLRYSEFYGRVLERLRALPGVRAAGLTNVLPIRGGTTDRFFAISGRPTETDINRRPDAELRIISSDYFRALGIRVLQGREFNNDDSERSPRVIIVNDELARRYFPGENPIGQRIEIAPGDPLLIIGVVRAVREVGLDRDLLPEFYVPARQWPTEIDVVSFVVSATGDPGVLGRQARDVVRSVAPRQPVFNLTTMRSVVRDSLGARRLLLTLLGLFAGLALVLSAAGVYGVMSYGVTQRRREIGIRIALGAKFGDVTGMVLRDVLGIAMLGLAIGVTVTLASARVLTSVLYGVGAYDVFTYLAALVAIGAVAILAGAVPAIRAARTDPLIAMQAE
jgi:predicted permease